MSETDGPAQPEPTASGTPAWATTGATPATPPPVAPGEPVPGEPVPGEPVPGEPGAAPTKKPRPAWLLPVAIVAAVVVVAGVVVAIVLSQGGDDTATPTPIPTPTVVGPVPTPSIAPAERPDPTDFTSALPASVLQYAFESEKALGTWADAGALEAVTDTYTDGGTGTITVDAGQFATARDATGRAAAVNKATKVEPTSPCCSLPQEGDVMAGGKKVGTYTIVDLGSGKGQAVWTNRTSVFRLTAPSDEVVNAYNAFPL